MGVAHHEDALFEVRHEAVEGGAVEAFAGDGGGEAFDDAHFVALGLEAADEPGSGVGQAAVVEVDGVLGRKDDAEAVGARLLEEGQHGGLGRRVGVGWEVAEDFVHVEDGAQGGGSGLAAGPGEDFVEQDGHEEHALGVLQVGDGEDGDAGAAVGGAEEAGDVQGFAFGPRGEGGGGHEVVEAHGEGEAVFGREEGFEGQDADAVESGFLDGLDEAGEVDGAAGAPVAVDDGGKEDVFAGLDGVGVDAGKGEYAGDGRGDAVAHGGGVVGEAGRRGVEGGEEGEGQAGLGAGGVDAEVGGGAEAGDAVAVFAPRGKALSPGGGGFFGALLGGEAFAGEFVGVEPGAEVVGVEVGEGE